MLLGSCKENDTRNRCSVCRRAKMLARFCNCQRADNPNFDKNAVD